MTWHASNMGELATLLRQLDTQFDSAKPVPVLTIVNHDNGYTLILTERSK